MVFFLEFLHFFGGRGELTEAVVSSRRPGSLMISQPGYFWYVAWPGGRLISH